MLNIHVILQDQDRDTNTVGADSADSTHEMTSIR